MKSLTELFSPEILVGDEAADYAERAQLGFTDPNQLGHINVLVAIDDARRNPIAEFSLASTIELEIRG